jgi:hypothetical protein
VDVNKLSPGQRIMALAGGLLFIDLWMSWYGIDTGKLPGAARTFLTGVDTTATAWQAFSFIDIVLAVTAVVAVGGAVMVASGRRLDLPVSPTLAALGLGALSTFLVFIRFIWQPGDNVPDKYISVEWGAYVGFLLCLGIVYGAWRAMSETTEPMAAAPPPPAATPAV